MSARATAAPYSAQGRIHEAQRMVRDLGTVLDDLEDAYDADMVGANVAPAAEHESGTRIRTARPAPVRLEEAPLSTWIAEAQRRIDEHLTSVERLVAAVDDVARAAAAPPVEPPVNVDLLLSELKDLATMNGKGGLAVAALWAERAPNDSPTVAANSWAAVLRLLGKRLCRDANWILNDGSKNGAFMTARVAQQIEDTARLATDAARLLVQAANAAQERSSGGDP